MTMGRTLRGIAGPPDHIAGARSRDTIRHLRSQIATSIRELLCRELEHEVVGEAVGVAAHLC
jgi:hypothetical protein